MFLSGFPLHAKRKSSGGDFPQTLSLTAYFRDWTGTGPWVGTPSAGISGDNDLTVVGTDPATFDINGYNAADFVGNGSGYFQFDGTLDTYVNADSVSGWCLFRVDVVSLSQQLIWPNSNGDMDLYLQHSPTPNRLNVAFGINGVYQGHTTNITSTTSWFVVTFRYDKITIQIGLNGAPNQSTAHTSNIAVLTDSLYLGDDTGTFHLNGKIAEVAISDQQLTDENFNDVIDYINNRYALSL